MGKNKKKKVKIKDFRKLLKILAKIEKLKIGITEDRFLLQRRLISDLKLGEVEICWIVVELERKSSIIASEDVKKHTDITVARFLYMFNHQE